MHDYIQKELKNIIYWPASIKLNPVEEYIISIVIKILIKCHRLYKPNISKKNILESLEFNYLLLDILLVRNHYLIISLKLNSGKA